jgi:hypothetical protein
MDSTCEWGAGAEVCLGNGRSGARRPLWQIVVQMVYGETTPMGSGMEAGDCG